MSWHFLRGEEAVSWDPASLDGPPSALSRSIPTAAAYYSHGSETECSRGSPSGTTSVHSADPPGAGMWTSCPEDSPAPTSAQREAGEACEARHRSSGSKCSVSSGRSGLPGCSSKTHHIYGSEAWERSSKGLPAWGTMRRGVVFRRGKPVLSTYDPVCGLLLTPTATGNEQAPLGQKWPLQRRLREAVADLQIWGNLPTPTPRNHGSMNAGKTRRRSLDSLTGGPWICWREWMMGWPIGWTALEPLEMDRWLEWLYWHGPS